ncbi:unnamed protein product [Paramecium pentaurelia]|uniref:Uncharacterized protein n=1 Tax=Paramecium pentaurelia TaxID=43138 RepID=A0A8S1YDV1_9CILI|nr:unnamed protein product [Paramecium pentaurelia]
MHFRNKKKQYFQVYLKPAFKRQIKRCSLKRLKWLQRISGLKGLDDGPLQLPHFSFNHCSREWSMLTLQGPILTPNLYCEFSYSSAPLQTFNQILPLKDTLYIWMQYGVAFPVPSYPKYLGNTQQSSLYKAKVQK